MPDNPFRRPGTGAWQCEPMNQLDDSWRSFARQCVPAGATPKDLLTYRVIFFCGALAHQRNLMARDGETLEASLARAMRLGLELFRFSAATTANTMDADRG